MITPTGFEIIQIFEGIYPIHLAEKWDNIGLQIGTLDKEVNKVLVTLDVALEVVEEAINVGAELIIAHHPIIFKPLKNLHTDTHYGKIIELCVKHDIAVYAAHTNLDAADGGVNDLLAEALELQNTEILDITYTEELKKLAVYIPENHVDEVKEAIHRAGAGHIGNYSHCSFSIVGEGSFVPEHGTTPYIGEIGVVEKVKEVRLETIFPSKIEKNVLIALLNSHPYEEVAYDIFKLDNKGKCFGFGRVGTLPSAMTLEEFAEFVKIKLNVPFVRMVGNKMDTVKKVAVLGGDGNDFIYHAVSSGADVFVTGDMKYHIAQDAQMAGLNIIDPGHNTEKVMQKGVQAALLEKCKDKYDISIEVSKINTEPFICV